MKTYSCKRCGYKTKKDFFPKSCSYCGENGVMIEVESAEEIIQDI